MRLFAAQLTEKEETALDGDKDARHGSGKQCTY